jgi:hypothetical protein
MCSRRTCCHGRRSIGSRPHGRRGVCVGWCGSAASACRTLTRACVMRCAPATRRATERRKLRRAEATALLSCARAVMSRLRQWCGGVTASHRRRDRASTIHPWSARSRLGSRRQQRQRRARARVRRALAVRDRPWTRRDHGRGRVKSHSACRAVLCAPNAGGLRLLRPLLESQRCAGGGGAGAPLRAPSTAAALPPPVPSLAARARACQAGSTQPRSMAGRMASCAQLAVASTRARHTSATHCEAPCAAAPPRLARSAVAADLGGARRVGGATHARAARRCVAARCVLTHASASICGAFTSSTLTAVNVRVRHAQTTRRAARRGQRRGGACAQRAGARARAAAACAPGERAGGRADSPRGML